MKGQGGFVVCAVCRGAAASGLGTCWSCRVVRRQLGTELTPVVPISLFSPGSPLHELLVGYKAAPSPTARRERQASLARLVGGFFDLHLGCLVGEVLEGDLATLAVPVPSSSEQRPSWGGQHPLVGLLRSAVAAQPDLCVAPVIVKGTETLGHLRASARGFRPVVSVAGRRVLVLDDTYTSGARSQSAAAALSGAGADVIAIVPIGRLIHPEYNEATGALWAHQQQEPFDPRRCAGACRRGQLGPDGGTGLVAEAGSVPRSCPLSGRHLGEQQAPQPARGAYEPYQAEKAQVAGVHDKHRTDRTSVEAA
jgi:predicted amidophosphoribosyltransferase